MIRRRPLQLLPLFALLILCGTMLPTAGAQPGAGKVEPLLLDRLAAGPADFVVVFSQQADLAPAYTMGWAERGQFVVDALTAAAEQSQGPARAYLDGRGLRHETFIAGNELYVWNGDLEAAQSLAAQPGVASVRAARTYFVDPVLAVAPTAPNALDWGIVDTKADQFWTTFGLQGDGIIVANIDTGVQWDHPALYQAYHCLGDPGNAACWFDPTGACGGLPCDDLPHGTHMMGTMVGDDDPGLTYQAGMAPNAQWIACKGCRADGQCLEPDLNACADWLLQPDGEPANRPHVVNLGWGLSGCNDTYLPQVQAWRAAGIFPTATGGGSGPSCDTLASPGDYQESFSAAAHDTARNAATFSSRGPSCYGHDPYTKPNISAPGVNVCSAIPPDDWTCWSGGATASAHPAGAVALLWSCNPDLVGQVDATFQLLQDTANTPPAGNCGAPPDGEGNYTYGYGYLDVLAAGLAGCLQEGTLAGYVYDDSANPLPGATVTANPGGTSTTANVDGSYTMTLEPGDYEVTAALPGYQSQTAPVAIVGWETTFQDFYLPYEGLWTMGPALCFDLTRMDAEFYPATGQVYVLGGRSGSNTVGTIYAFDPATGACVNTGATMPTPISNYTINLVNDGTYDVLCTFGGRRVDGTNTLDVQCYNPLINTATVVAQLPDTYTGFVPGAQAVLDNRVFVFGGFRPTTAPYELDLTYSYNPVSQNFFQWSPLSLARSYLFAGVVGRAIYAFGGTTYDGANLVAQTRAEVLREQAGWWAWDDAAVADLPVASAEGQAFSFSEYIYPGYAGKIVLAGGGQWPNDTAEAIVYEAFTDSYDELFPALNVSRRNHAGVLVPLCTEDPGDGRPAMWVLGGRCSASGCGYDNPPYGPAEYLPLSCIQPAPVCQQYPTGKAALSPGMPDQGGKVRAHFGSTDFQALNLAFDTQSLSATFLAPDGEYSGSFSFTLPGGGTGVYTPAPTLPPGFTGTLLLDVPVRAAMAVVHLEDPPEMGGNTVFPGVPDDTVGPQAYTPVDGCTALHIHNLDTTAIADVTVFLYDYQGIPVEVVPGQVPPQGTWTVDLRMYNFPAGFIGGAVVAADQRIEVTAQAQCHGYSAYGAAAYCDTMLTAPYVPGSQPGQVTATLLLQNPSNEPVSAIVTYTTGASQTSVPPWGTQILPHDYGEDEWVRISSSFPLVASIQILNRTPGGAGAAGYRLLGRAEATRAVALPVLFSGDHGWQTANLIWVMNIGDAPTLVKIRFSNNLDDSLAWAEQVVQPGSIWRTVLPPMPGTRAAAIVLADPDQPIIAVAGATNPDPDLHDGQILYAGTNFSFPYGPVTGADISATVDFNVVTFDGSVAGGYPPIDYAWSFGDGSSGAGQHVVHTYGVGGTYTVAMTATNSLGFYSATASQTVTVENLPVTYSIYLPVVLRAYGP